MTLAAGLSQACDTHVHVIGPQSRFAMQAARVYTPGDAPRPLLDKHLQALQLGRVVVVQPSFYGFDNSCTLHAVAELNATKPDSARAVVVVPEGIDEAGLAQLHAGGVRGVRINLDSGGHGGEHDTAAHLRALAVRIAPFGWHVQVLAQVAALLPLLPTLAQLPVRVVLDHFAGISDTSMASPDAQTILALVASGQAYVKLSAPYRLPGALAATARAFARANPERILWGSDWPHTQREPGRARLEVSRFQIVDSASNLRELCECIDDAAFIKPMLVANPARLYGFGLGER